MEQALQGYQSALVSDEFRAWELLREKAEEKKRNAVSRARREGEAKGKAEGIEEVFALLTQGYSVDEAKAILAKKRTTERS